MELQIITQEEALQRLPALLTLEPSAKYLLTACALYCKEQNLNNEIDCFHSKAKTLGFIENQHPKTGLALLVVMVGELADSFNIGKNMSAVQVTDTALMILNDYPELKIDDVALCFSKAKKGAYGKVYDRLDCAVIFGWIEQFLKDKHEQIDYYWKYEQNTIKEENSTLLLEAPKAADDKVALSYINKIKSDISAIQRRNVKAKQILTTPQPENVVQQIHNKWMTDFRNIYQEQSFTMEKPLPYGFIFKYGKNMDIMEYIKIKHDQLSNYIEKINLRWGL